MLTQPCGGFSLCNIRWHSEASKTGRSRLLHRTNPIVNTTGNQSNPSLIIYICCFYMFLNTGSCWDFRVGGSGRKWHLWTSLQGWCAPPSVCVCVSVKASTERTDRRNLEHKHAFLDFSLLSNTFFYTASLGTGAVWTGLSL